MGAEEKRMEVTPTHLSWLAKKLRIEDKNDLTPDFTALLETMPSGLYKYPAGTEVVREGDMGDEVYVVFCGKLLVSRKKGHPAPIELGALEEGDLFGEIGFLMKFPRSATVITVCESQLFRFKSAAFAELIKRHKPLADWVNRTARERLQKIFLSQL